MITGCRRENTHSMPCFITDLVHVGPLQRSQCTAPVFPPPPPPLTTAALPLACTLFTMRAHQKRARMAQVPENTSPEHPHIPHPGNHRRWRHRRTDSRAVSALGRTGCRQGHSARRAGSDFAKLPADSGVRPRVGQPQSVLTTGSRNAQWWRSTVTVLL